MRNVRRRTKLMAEINITPFTDVLMVLLIIFMVTTPLILQSGIGVDLPKTTASQTHEDSTLTITIDNKSNVYFRDKLIDMDNLSAEIGNRLKDDPKTVVVVNADRTVAYDYVMQVLDIATQCGAESIALSTEKKK